MLLSRQSHLFSLSGLNALVGLILGVACLVVSMAVMSGFESTLQKSVSDVTGHVQVLIRSAEIQAQENSKEDLTQKIKEVESSLIAATRFTYVEAVVAHQGKISGVILQGLDPVDALQVLHLTPRIRLGQFDLSFDQVEFPKALIGVGLAEQMGLEIGDTFRIVMPLRNELDPNQFRRKLGTLQVSGIMDFGKHEFNQRMILTSLQATQQLAEIGSRYSGLLLRFKDFEKAPLIAQNLDREMGPGFAIRDWRESNKNIFDAVGYERVIVFFVISVIVIAAAFNVASALFINVISRYSQIGLLKALGMSEKKILRIFQIQGLLLGLFGLTGGFLLGNLLCFGVTWIESKYNVLPGSIYKLDQIDLAIRFGDSFAIVTVTMLICFIATWAPARKGARMAPLEGIKND